MKLKALFLAALVAASPAFAASLTPEQQTALRGDILADPALSQLPPGPDTAYSIAAAYTLAPAVPCVVWRTALTPGMARSAIISASTQVDALTASKRDTLFWMVSGDLNPSDPSVRAGLDDVTGAQTTLRNAMQAAQKRNANRLEKLFASGSCTSASPATMAIEGTITYQQVMSAMGW